MKGFDDTEGVEENISCKPLRNPAPNTPRPDEVDAGVSGFVGTITGVVNVVPFNPPR